LSSQRGRGKEIQVWELRGSMTEEAVERAHFRIPWFRSGILVAACLSFLSGAANAQALQGSVQSNSSSGTDIYSLYAGEDPLGGKPEVAPTSIGPKGNVCIAPNPKWQLVTQIGNMCYWYAPFPKKLAGYVVPMSKISWVESGGGRCGVNPFSNPNDPNGTAICNQPPPAENPHAPKGNAGKSPDPSMPGKSGCETQGTFIPHCYYTDSAGKPTSNPTGNTGPYCFYQDDFGFRTSPPVLCVIRAYPRTTTPSPLPGELPAEAAGPSKPVLDSDGKCGKTYADEQLRHNQKMAELTLEYQTAESYAVSSILRQMDVERELDGECIAKLKAATPAPTPAHVKYTGRYQRQPDGSYWMWDTRGVIWSAPEKKTIGGGSATLKIDPTILEIKQRGNQFYATTIYRGYDWNRTPTSVAGEAKPVGGNWKPQAPQ
jgi:hypothetical protein